MKKTPRVAMSLSTINRLLKSIEKIKKTLRSAKRI